DLYEVFTNSFTFDFMGKEMTMEEASSHVHSESPKEREEAYKTLLGKFKENSTVLSEIYKNIVLDWYNEDIKIRNHKTPISVRNYYNDLDDSTVKTMLEVVRENSNLYQEYFKLKYDIMQRNGNNYPFSRYHLYAPYRSASKEYDYETSKKIVLETYREFDERFFQAANKIWEKKHVHSHPVKNKRSGAFSFGVYNKETPYIMLNHTNKLRDLFVMMHEMGHGIHDCLASNQVDLLFHTTLPMAETASVFSEKLLSHKLKEAGDKEEKIAILMYLLDSQYATIMRQSYFVFFEQIAHDMILKGATKEEIDKEYMKLLKEQFGGMEVPDDFKGEWHYISHFHFAPFYCYAYAWGNLFVLSLYAMYKEQGKDFIEKYVEMLSQGGGKKPSELMAIMGIDPNAKGFWQKGFDIIKEEINELIELTS
ncbi:M3 family metallopeptidase, partial [Nanoarchaeota archaeon]